MTPAGRLRALKRLMPWAAGALAVFVVLAVTGKSDAAFLMALFGSLAGAAIQDATKSRIKLERWRQAYGTLPPEDDA
jgi:hypothetical protein